MDLLIIVVSLHEFVVDVHCSFVVSVVESAIGDAHIGLEVVAVAVLSITVE